MVFGKGKQQLIWPITEGPIYSMKSIIAQVLENIDLNNAS